MTGPRLLALLLAVVALVAPTPATPLAVPEPLAGYLLGPGLVRAEVIRLQDGVLHDLRLDRGRVRAVRADAVVLAERDGTLATVPVSGATEIRIRGRSATLAELKRGMWAATIREGDAPASRVVAAWKQPGLPASLLGGRLVRAEMILKDGSVLHDFRLDAGRIRAVRADAVTLAERDGTVAAIPVTATTEVRIDGALASLAALRRGMPATALRDGDAPASLILAAERR